MEFNVNLIWKELEGTNYIVIRNYKNLENEIAVGGDIDLLCESRDVLIKKLNLVPRFQPDNLNNCKAIINGIEIPIDIRYIGDNYYDRNWEKDMLSRKEKRENCYIVSKYDENPSLLYHILLHKKEIPDKYINFLLNTYKTLEIENLICILAEFMNKHSYIPLIPLDEGVCFNVDNYNKLMKEIIND